MSTVYSHSRLSSFEQCKQKFEFRYLLEIPEETEGIEAFVGKRVHEILERLYQFVGREQLPSLRRVLERYHAEFDEHYDSDRIRIVRSELDVAYYRELGVRCLSDFYRDRYPFDQDETLGLEYHVQIDLDMSLHFWAGERELEKQTPVYRGPILLTYDHRYNLEHAAKHREKNRKPRPPRAELSAEPPPREDQLSIAPIDARRLQPKPTRWHDWLAPQLLLECTNTAGRTIRLCDFASAGDCGTPYVSWLPIRNAPNTPFTRRRPLRSAQLNR